MMITCKVIDRTEDRKLFKLEDTNDKIIEISIEDLREGIKTGKLRVINVTMGVDGRIIVKEKSIKDTTNAIHLEPKERFQAQKRVWVDGKTWWCVYDLLLNGWSTYLCHGRYKTKKEAQANIDYYNNDPEWVKSFKKV